MVLPTVLLEASGQGQSSMILRLPLELLIMIFKYVGSVADVCLTITCKQLIKVSYAVDLMIPSASKHRNAHSSGCLAMRCLLHLVGPVDSRNRLTKTLAICCYCFRFRPTRKSYWKVVRKKFPTDRWKLAVVDDKIGSWCRRSSLQCPECLCKEELCLSTGTNVRAY
ncbi:hypothetical protein BX600DRAFT_72802 [Xylariales sp. PMI_506]|nr:hypothetical protein BX600DRAFT_72802 [Xylariales sp. PMI_506]